MTSKEEWIARLQELGEAATAKQIEDLAREMISEVTAPGQAASTGLDAEQWQHEVSQMLLLELGPACLEGLLQGPLPKTAQTRAWLVERLLENELQLRARVRARIMSLLDDKEWLPDPQEGPPMEIYPPRRRVCDEAYVAMRALTHPEEDQVGFSVETEEFLHMPPELKDEHIERAKTSHVWNQAAPDPDDV